MVEDTMVERHPQERRWKGPAAVVGSLLVGTAAIFGISKLTGTGEPKPVDDNRPTPATSIPPKSETPPPTISPTEKPTPSPTEAPKALPEIINKDTVKFVVKSPEEVQRMMDDAKARGEDKLPLPDVLNNDGISMVQVHDKQGRSLFAITSTREGDYVLPALNSGKMLESSIDNTSAFNEVATISNDNKVSFYVVPTPSSGTVKQGENVVLSQQIIKFKYKPTSNDGQAFVRFIHLSYPDAPENTIAIVGAGTNHGPASIAIGSILTTEKGEVVLVSTQK